MVNPYDLPISLSLNNPSVQVLKIQVRKRLFKTVQTLVKSSKTV